MSVCSAAAGGMSSWVCLGIGTWEFVVIIALLFGLFMLLAGIFTAYFGSGKSRMIGVALLVVGIVVGVGAALYYHSLSEGHLSALIEELVVVLVASIIGAALAVGIFLVAIMKS